MTKELVSIICSVRNLNNVTLHGIKFSVFKFYSIVFLAYYATSFATCVLFSSNVIGNSVERCEHKPHMAVERNLQKKEWRIVTLFEIWGKHYCSHNGRRCAAQKIQFPSNRIIIWGNVRLIESVLRALKVTSDVWWGFFSAVNPKSYNCHLPVIGSSHSEELGCSQSVRILFRKP
jgi:hypothetical protein